MKLKKKQLELDMEQQTGFKSGKEYIKAVYCYSAYLTSFFLSFKLNCCLFIVMEINNV